MRILRGSLGLLGELLITAGVLVLLFIGWQLWWTDVIAEADARQTVRTLENRFDAPVAAAELGDATAIVRIPRFGTDYARPLYDGVDRATLSRGIGHYPQTVGPGEVGNFAIAGHRTTYGKPFNQIDRLRSGDAIIIETRDHVHLYRVSADQIVAPDQASVLLPVPDQPGEQPREAVLTMTSCHPEYSSRERYVVHAVLAASYPHDQGVVAGLLQAEG